MVKPNPKEFLAKYHKIPPSPLNALTNEILYDSFSTFSAKGLASVRTPVFLKIAITSSFLENCLKVMTHLLSLAFKPVKLSSACFEEPKKLIPFLNLDPANMRPIRLTFLKLIANLIFLNGTLYSRDGPSGQKFSGGQIEQGVEIGGIKIYKSD